MQLRPRAYRPLLLSLMLLPASAYRVAKTTIEVGGTITLTTTADSRPGKDAAGRAAYVGGSSGRNESSGKTEFLDGATVVTADTSNLVDGTGPHHGAITLSDGVDGLRCSWKGRVTTVVGADRIPHSTSVGTWTVIRGSGRYAGATGRGTYTGRFTSSTTMVMEWTGKLVQ